MKRPQLDYATLAEIDPLRPAVSPRCAEETEIAIKYEGYILRQQRLIEEGRKLEETPLPDGVDYTECNLIRLEARQKLQKIRPRTYGQAGRISGISPSDISALMVWLHTYGKSAKEKKDDK